MENDKEEFVRLLKENTKKALEIIEKNNEEKKKENTEIKDKKEEKEKKEKKEKIDLEQSIDDDDLYI